MNQKRSNPFTGIYKICNESNNREKYERVQNKKEVPIYIDIELTNYCNIRCNMCPVGTKNMKRHQGMMNSETFERVCQQIEKNDIKGVRLIRWGEPTIHPYFLEYLKRLKQIEGLLVHFNTNGIHLSDRMLTEIVNMQIDSVKFSFQGIDELTYSEMQSGGKFNTIIDNIKRLYEIRGNAEKPYIFVTTTTTYESSEEIKYFKNEIEKYCDELVVGKTNIEFVDLNEMNISSDRYKLYKDYINNNKMTRMPYLQVCPELFDKLSINWDGTVSACCKDFDNQMIIGNIMEQDIKELFHNRIENEYRKSLVEKEYTSLPLCEKCYEYIALKK